MRIAVLGDTHFGMRGDSTTFHAYYKKFYSETFFPYLKEQNINCVVQTGDLFDRRKFVNFNTLFLARQYFFNHFVGDLKLITYVGNHDTYYKNTLEVNSLDLIANIEKDRNIQVVSKPTTINFDGLPIDVIPWICEENSKEISDYIKDSKSQICFGHFEIAGFEMDRGFVCADGMSRDDLSKYEIVLSGHFHHKSTDGHIFYVGSPGEMTWADYGDKRGFHIFDTETREIEFIENPHRMFHKVVYNDSLTASVGRIDLEILGQMDFSKLHNTMVKVVVMHKDNPVLFDHFMDALYKIQPLDISIVEDFTEYNSMTDDDIINQADTTTDILDKFIDNIEVGVDKSKLKNIMRDVYIEAQNLEMI